LLYKLSSNNFCSQSPDNENC